MQVARVQLGLHTVVRVVHQILTSTGRKQDASNSNCWPKYSIEHFGASKTELHILSKREIKTDLEQNSKPCCLLTTVWTPSSC